MRSIQSTFVDREREMAELGAGLEEARAGRGSFFLISGEPGIGKTRLADEVGRRAADEAMTVLRAGSWEGGGAPAYWPFVQVIRAALDGPDREVRRANALRAAPALAQLIPELQPAEAGRADASSSHPLPDAEQARFRLFDAVAAALRTVAAVRPLILILEDLHDSDQPSLLMLRFVVGQLKNAAVMVLATYRDVEVQRSPALSRLIGDLLHEGTQLPLSPLSREDVARMIEDRAAAPPNPRLVSDIHQASAGNPLFIDGLVRVLAAEGALTSTGRLNLAASKVPDGVREAIRRWLDLLPERSVLTIAAAIAQEFELRCLQRVTGAPNHQLLDALRAAAAVGIVTARSPGRYRFTHALIRNALSDELNSADRGAAHLKIGEAIEELYPADIDVYAASLAHHFREGGAINQAIGYSIRAGEAARALFAYEDAIAHWEAALELMPESFAARERRASLLERMGQLLALTESEGERQFRYLRHALKLYTELGHSEAAGRVEINLAGFLMLRGSPTDISRALEPKQRVDRSPSLDRKGQVSSAWRHNAEAVAASEAMRTERTLAQSRQAMEIGERLDEALIWARTAIPHAGGLLAKGELANSFELIRKVLDEGDRINDDIASIGMLSFSGSMLCWLCDPTEGSTRLRHELSKPRLAEARVLRGALAGALRSLEIMAGNLREARELAFQAQRDRRVEGQLAFYEGEWETADLAIGQAVEQSREGGSRIRACISTHWLARVQRALGRHSAAETLLRENLGVCIEGPHVPLELHTRVELASIYAESGRPEQAHSHLARCREVLAAGEDWRGFVGHVARAEAVIAAAERRFEDAESQFGRAVQIYRRYQVPFEAAEALRYWGRAMIAAGDRGMALDKLDAAAEIYRRHGAGERWIEAIQTDRSRAQNAAAISVATAPVVAPRAETVVAPAIGGGAGRDENSRLTGVFRSQGEYWTMSWADSEARLRERKGFHYIAWLLRYPGREFAAQDLLFMAAPPSNGSAAGGVGGGQDHQLHATIARGLGDAGAILDATAKDRYRRRLHDLGEELELAGQHNDLGRAARTREEMEFIEAEITAATGLGGRDRKAISHSERVRLAVTKAIKAALVSIRAANPELGRHLSVTIRTGHSCIYLPAHAINWDL